MNSDWGSTRVLGASRSLCTHPSLPGMTPTSGPLPSVKTDANYGGGPLYTYALFITLNSGSGHPIRINLMSESNYGLCTVSLDAKRRRSRIYFVEQYFHWLGGNNFLISSTRL